MLRPCVQLQPIQEIVNMNNKFPNNFCILPWTALEVQPNGTVKPCCMYKDTLKNSNGQEYLIQKDSMDEIWNSDELNEVRKRFLSGTQPRGCHRCWMEEISGKDSKRVRDNKRYSKHINEDVIFNQDNQPKYLDLKLGNICNLKCRICSPQYSSKWIAERKRFDIIDGIHEEYERLDWPEKSKLFWENIETILPHIEHLDFTGGEPFLIKEHFDLLEKIKKLNLAHRITIHYNTNGTQLPMNALQNIWPYFKEVDIHFSIDGIGKHFEYQRHPAKWDQVVQNMLIFKEHRSDKLTLSICHTVNIFNVLYLPEFLKWTKEIDYSVYLNSLHEPKHYNITCLPYAQKIDIKDKLVNSEHDFSQVINFMMQTTEPKHYNKLLKEIERTDIVRHEKFNSVFPEMKSLFQGVLI